MASAGPRDQVAWTALDGEESDEGGGSKGDFAQAALRDTALRGRFHSPVNTHSHMSVYIILQVRNFSERFMETIRRPTAIEGRSQVG